MVNLRLRDLLRFPLLLPVLLLALLLNWALPTVHGIVFVLDKKECFQHEVEYDYDTVYASFVIIKSDIPWAHARVGVDVTAEGPLGQLYYTGSTKESDRFEFLAPRKGHYKFCFTNRSPTHEAIDFNVHVGHRPDNEELAKNEHFTPLMSHIARLEEALYSVRFEQHWLAAQTTHQAIVNQAMSKRVIYKAFLESAAIVGASFVQVYLLQRLFERKLGKSSRV